LGTPELDEEPRSSGESQGQIQLHLLETLRRVFAPFNGTIEQQKP
jgi:hypothetical protein